MNCDWLDNATQKELAQFKSVCNQLLSKTFAAANAFTGNYLHPTGQITGYHATGGPNASGQQG